VAGWAEAAGTGAPAVVLLRDAHALLHARRDPAIAEAETAAALVLPDGMPLVWLLRRAGLRRAERVYGPDLMEAVCALTAGRPVRHAFLGGAPGVAARLADGLTRRHPGLKVAGTLAPAVAARPDRALPDAPVIAAIEALAPDILWVGLGAPKQDLWMAAYGARLRLPVMVGVGAAFDILSGRRRQAPPGLRRAGLEWAWRLAQEPRRLGGRYARTVPAFALLAVGWLLSGAVRTER
jgi:N-acetylglucosaminyldiphosphoundecaprenol N-acetyl-beta-D-mannosaminyltransferase